MKTVILFLGPIIILSVGCRSVEKMIDYGNFDEAVAKSIKRIAGKEQVKRKYVMAIEEAFKKANNRDMSLVDQAFHSNRANDWKEVISILSKIEHRQMTLQGFLPLVAKDGYQATFSFVKTAALRETAIHKFQDLTYSEAKKHLSRARAGQKSAARTAYETFNELWDFSNDYRDGKDLQEEARDLGISHILVDVINRTGEFIPSSALNQIVHETFKDEFWINYHFDRNINDADRNISIELTNLEVGPEQIHEVTYVDRREIEDGFEYVLDQNGNVAKDTLGNDIKTLLFKTIKARVTKISQRKEAVLTGTIINRNLAANEVDYIPFEAALIFEHCSGNFRGNRRALSAESRNLVEISPLPFPDKSQMVTDLMVILQPIIGSKLKRKNLLS